VNIETIKKHTDEKTAQRLAAFLGANMVGKRIYLNKGNFIHEFDIIEAMKMIRNRMIGARSNKLFDTYSEFDDIVRDMIAKGDK